MKKVCGAATLFVFLPWAVGAADSDSFRERISVACSIYEETPGKERLFAGMEDFAKNNWTRVPGTLSYRQILNWLEQDPEAANSTKAEIKAITGQSSDAGPKTLRRAGKLLEWVKEGLDLSANDFRNELSAAKDHCIDAPFNRALSTYAEMGAIFEDHNTNGIRQEVLELWRGVVNAVKQADEDYQNILSKAYSDLPGVKKNLSGDQRNNFSFHEGNGLRLEALPGRGDCRRNSDRKCIVECGSPAYKIWFETRVSFGEMEITRRLDWETAAQAETTDSNIWDGPRSDLRIGDTHSRWAGMSDPTVSSPINDNALFFVGASLQLYAEAAQKQQDVWRKTILQGDGVLRRSVQIAGFSLHNTKCKRAPLELQFFGEDFVPQYLDPPVKTWGLTGLR